MKSITIGFWVVSLCANAVIQSNSVLGFCSMRNAFESRRPRSVLFSDWDDNSEDSNLWKSADENYEASEDWQELMARKNDGSFWNTFESSEDETKEELPEETTTDKGALTEEETAESWLETLASLQAEEVEFVKRENERADTARQMQEWGFEASTIESTLGIAVDTSLEDKDEVDGMQIFREESYLDDVDLTEVESHTRVEKDPETGEPIRNQMVYVDEHSCIGCTNCAMIAQSTFFMESEYGRARVFNQWGDDEETIQVAIETCPVDCIHYVPYDELKALEIDRRDQTLNFKSRLVSEGGDLGHMVGGAVAFSGPQAISGNMAPRCNNCPTAGCKNCPMYGVGKNPEYEKREAKRLAAQERRRLAKLREEQNKSADL